MSALPNEPTQIVRVHVPRRSHGVVWLAVSVIALGLLALVFLRWASETHVAVSAAERALRLSPWPEDTLVVAPDTELSIQTRPKGPRRLRLAHGVVLCDVEARAEPLRVESAQARVEAQAAVFTVQAELGRTLVRVYEGEVRAGGKRLQAGDVWLSAGTLPEGPAPLEHEAREAAHLLTKAEAAPPPERAPAKSAVPDAREVLAEARRSLAEGDAQRALQLVERDLLDDDRSAVREPASLLRIDALLALGQESAARVHALRYLSREPETPATARLRALVQASPR